MLMSMMILFFTYDAYNSVIFPMYYNTYANRIGIIIIFFVFSIFTMIFNTYYNFCELGKIVRKYSKNIYYYRISQNIAFQNFLIRSHIYYVQVLCIL